MIESLQNEKVKNWKKLKKRKQRDLTKTFLIEGWHLIEEAMKSHTPIKEIILDEEVDWTMEIEEASIYRVSSAVFREISSTETPQGVLAVVQMQDSKIEKNAHKKILMLDAIQDPGNVGTIIRTADALGYDAILSGKGTVDLYNDKTVRATQGSIFHIPVITGNLHEWCTDLQNDGWKVYATSLKGAKPIQSVKSEEQLAVILGNEGKGVHPSLVELADEKIYIPILGRAESLNVSVAAGIIMHYFGD